VLDDFHLIVQVAILFGLGPEDVGPKQRSQIFGFHLVHRGLALHSVRHEGEKEEEEEEEEGSEGRDWQERQRGRVAPVQVDHEVFEDVVVLLREFCEHRFELLRVHLLV